MSIHFDKAGGPAGVGADVVGGKSLSRMFAELQMLASENAKTKAKDMMETIKRRQSRLKDAYAAKQALQGKLSDAGDDEAVDVNSTTFKDSFGKTRSLKDWMKENGLKLPTLGDKAKGEKLVLYWIKRSGHSPNDVIKMKKEDIKAAIARIDTKIESLGTDTQTQMIRLQDFMGQYNNFLQGAHKAISDGKQTLNTILTR
ncbi:hypothetical protein [Halodesulfovibrio marinisediminis]|uniref:Uncharacterized protein n=1 Tax=Halodesulfovibrio marinisediminis DSM 17456 TaxID=1121457 RepID=A0A1N6I9C7_9BACT|nr:hypothetical protein [Halodesulfovibrio marinisediminis]SIO28621.1 hypothetical protein SAMN02745161_2542 [Halodesulfovibrio marinisediminis DSM 17456]